MLSFGGERTKVLIPGIEDPPPGLTIDVTM